MFEVYSKLYHHDLTWLGVGYTGDRPCNMAWFDWHIPRPPGQFSQRTVDIDEIRAMVA